MKPPGNLVGIVIEFTAGVKCRHDDFGGGRVLFFVEVDRDTPTVIDNRDGVVRPDRDIDGRTVACQCLIDAVVDHFENHVVQTGTIVRVADVHTGAFAYGIEAFEDLDVR